MRGVVFILVLLLLCSQAHAYLGGGANTPEQDRKAFHGVRRVTLTENYSVEEITTNSVVIREYLRADGTVFALSWSGIAQPNLSQLLGSYYPEYVTASHATPRPAGRGIPMQVHSQNLVSIRYGHLGDLHHLIYIPGLAPAGFDSHDIH